MTVVETLFDKLHYKTEKLWMEKWTDVEKEQLFMFFVFGYSLTRKDYPGEKPFVEDVQQHEFLKDAFIKYYESVFKQGRS